MRTTLRLFFVQHQHLFADDFGHIALDPLLILESTELQAKCAAIAPPCLHKTHSPSHKQIINQQLIGNRHQIMLILFYTKNAEHGDEDIFL